MIIRFVFVLCLLCVSSISAYASSSPKMRRVCRDPSPSTNNTVYFYPSSDTCSSFYKYFVWARNGVSGPFLLLDSIANKSASEYNHLNANPGTPTLWYYFIEYVDSCGPDFSLFSDTLVVDIAPPDTIFIDSASVNINTNRVEIGWRGNKAPDFLNYILYKIDALGIFTPLTPTGIRDTFFIDGTTNPQTQTFRYDLLSRDSCTNPQVFGINPHRPMVLNYSVDTCAYTLSLSWTPYLGWPVRRYYIYLSEFGNAFNLIDSVNDQTTNYTWPIAPGIPYRVFIRAFADTTYLLSSSSNDVSFSLRNRIEPNQIRIKNVTNLSNGNGPIAVTIEILNGGEAKEISLTKQATGGAETAAINALGQNSIVYEHYTPNDRHYEYDALVYGLCDDPFGNSNRGNNIVLNVSHTGQDVLLTWNSQRTWNTQPRVYRIYRAILNDNVSLNLVLTDSVSGSDSTYIDVGGLNASGRNGIAYVVAAVDNNPGQLVSYSNRERLIGTSTVFVPNAFVPSGVNRVFNVVGAFLDLQKSSLVIYDRWGGVIFSKEDIREGWDGRDMNGSLCPIGIYHYRFTIFDLDGKEYQKTGTVTLLN